MDGGGPFYMREGIMGTTTCSSAAAPILLPIGEKVARSAG